MPRLFAAPAALLAAALLAGCGGSDEGSDPRAPGVSVSEGWVRPAPEGRAMTAAYLTVRTTDGSPDALLSVSSDAAANVELHETIDDDGVMKMRPVARIALGETGAVLEPGGYHVMLIGVSEPLAEGDVVTFDLEFEKAGRITTTLPVSASKPE